MPMNLDFGITLECGPEECRVAKLDGGEPVTVRYSERARANIRIFPGQLVAVDLNSAVPEVVFRWHHFPVKKLNGDKIVLDNTRGLLVEAVLAPGLEANPQPGDLVFATVAAPGGQGGQSEILDTSVDGRPAHPAFVRSHATAMVEEFYRKMEERTQ